MSIQCPKCNAIAADNADFCPNCGVRFNRVPTGGAQPNYGGGANYGGGNGGANSYDFYSMIIDSDEKVQGEFTATPFLTFMSGNGFGQTKLFYTQKRLYAKSRRFKILDKGLIDEEFIVDLKDVTGTSIQRLQPFMHIVVGALWFIASCPTLFLIPLGLIFLGVGIARFFLRRGIIINISSAGVTERFYFQGGNYETASIFHKNLRAHMQRMK